MTEQRTLRFAIGDRVETAHGKHSALERGTIVELPKPYNSDEWYGVELDCGCCSLSLDWRADGFGRIRAARETGDAR